MRKIQPKKANGIPFGQTSQAWLSMVTITRFNALLMSGAFGDDKEQQGNARILGELVALGLSAYEQKEALRINSTQQIKAR